MTTDPLQDEKDAQALEGVLLSFTRNVSDSDVAMFKLFVPELVNTTITAEDPHYTKTLHNNDEIKLWLGIARRVHVRTQRGNVWCAAHMFARAVKLQPDVTDSAGEGPALTDSTGIVQSETIGKHTVQYATVTLTNAADLIEANSRLDFFTHPPTPYGPAVLLIEQRLGSPVVFT